MSRNIDTRVVEMEFNNAQFERGVKETSSLLDRLKDALKLGGAKDGLEDVQRAADGLTLEGIGAGVDNISSKFSALGAIGFSVLQDLTRRAMDLGGNLIRKVADPILGGGRRRALNLEQAHFMFEGLDMDAEAVMENANNAVLGTAFGLDEAAKAASQFGASGMEAGEEMESALRGISGVAAMTSSEYSDIADIFTKISGNGRVMGDDLLRMSSRGLNAASELAEAFGMTEAEVRELVTQGEISFEMFYQAMDQAFGEHATRANETYTGSLANMRAALSRIGAEFFSDHLRRQRDLFNAITPLINRVNDALAPLFERMHAFLDLKYENIVGFLEGLDSSMTGGRILAGIFNLLGAAVDTLMTYLSPIGQAFKEIFGGTTATDIFVILNHIRNFVDALALSEAASDNLRRTFAGIFAIFDIGIFVLMEVARMIGRVITSVFEGADGFLELTGGVGDSIVAFRDAIKEGDGLRTVLDWIGDAIIRVIEFFGNIGGAIATGMGRITEFFTNLFDFSFLQDEASNVSEMLSPFEAAATAIRIVWNGMIAALGAVWNFAAPAVMWVIDGIKNFMSTLGEAFRSDDFSKVLDVINTGLLATIALTIKKFFDNLKEAKSSGGIMDTIKSGLGGLQNVLQDYQNNLKADTLTKIAIAIGVLAASVLVLSLIDPARLTSAIGGLTVMLGQLMGAMAVMSRPAVGTAAMRLPAIAAGLILLAAALAILTIPVVVLSNLSWSELLRGLAGLAGMLILMVPTSAILSGLSGSFIRIGLAMIPFALGITILAGALKKMGDLEWDEIGRGLTAMGGSLLIIAGALALIPSASVFRKGASLVLLAAAINLLVPPLERMGALSWAEIGRGLTTLAGAMLIMAVGLRMMAGTTAGSLGLMVASGALNILIGPLERMSKLGWEEIGKVMTTLAGSLIVLAGGLYLMSGTLLGAASLIVAAGALNILIGPLERMSQFGWQEIGKIMTVLAGSLILIAAALIVMSGTLLGSAALIVAAGALAILTPVLIALGGMSWMEIVIGLTALAGALTIIGLAGLVLTPVLPSLLILGAALVLIGAGMLAAGAGLALFGIGLTAVGVAVATTGGPIIQFIKDLITLLPDIATALAHAIADFIITLIERSGDIILAFGDLISDILTMIRDKAPEFRETFVTVITEFLTAIREVAPEIRATLVTVIQEALQAVRELAPDVAETAMVLVHTILDTIEENMDSIVEKGVAIVEALIRGILSHLFGMDEAGVDSVMEYIGGIRKNLGKLVEKGVEIVDNVIEGITSFFTNLFSTGEDSTDQVADGVSSGSALEAMRNAGKAIIDALGEKIRDLIPDWASNLGERAKSIGSSIVSGITGSISSDSALGRIASAGSSLGRRAISAAKSALDSNSPSKAFMRIGEDINAGLVIGIDRFADQSADASEKMAKGTLDPIQDAMANLPHLFDGIADTSPVIRPVIDLDEVRSGAERINGILGGSIGSPYSRASRVAALRRQYAQETAEQTTASNIEYNINYEQTNNSPKALTTAEIYRQTKNQISTLKGALSI